MKCKCGSKLFIPKSYYGLVEGKKKLIQAKQCFECGLIHGEE